MPRQGGQEQQATRLWPRSQPVPSWYRSGNGPCGSGCYWHKRRLIPGSSHLPPGRRWRSASHQSRTQRDPFSTMAWRPNCPSNTGRERQRERERAVALERGSSGTPRCPQALRRPAQTRGRDFRGMTTNPLSQDSSQRRPWLLHNQTDRNRHTVSSPSVPPPLPPPSSFPPLALCPEFSHLVLDVAEQPWKFSDRSSGAKVSPCLQERHPSFHVLYASWESSTSSAMNS